MIIDQNFMSEIMRQRLPRRRRRSTRGWDSMACVMCHHRGKSQDKIGKGGIIFSGPAFTYKCWRCAFKVHWRPGMFLSAKLADLLGHLGLDEQEVNDLKLRCLELREFVDFILPEETVLDTVKFKTKTLPNKAKSIFELAKEGCTDPNYLQVASSLLSRGDRIVESSDFYWTNITPHQLNKRYIIPFYYDDELVGYTARFAGEPPDNIPKYYSSQQHGFLFNNHYLDDYARKYIVLVEGSIDALAINGVGYLSNKLTALQINWLKQSGKDIIMLADREESGMPAIEQAIEQHWAVSFPDWDVKDADEAVRQYGVIWAVRSIIECQVAGTARIKQRVKLWLK